ncbi:MAG: CHRD domain-containing protein [Verrucomicrobiales bacterium]|nr:CHRD domain-containing protein [Verrucomicrobiales bacterium]
MSAISGYLESVVCPAGSPAGGKVGSVGLRQPGRKNRRGGPQPRELAWGAAFLLALGNGAGASVRGEEVTLPVVADAFISSYAPGNNAGGVGWVDAGGDGQGGVRRGLLRFDLSGVPSGATVTSAEVRLTLSKAPPFGPATVGMNLHRLNVAWGEGTKTGNNGAAATTGEANWTARVLGSEIWTEVGGAADAEATPSGSASAGTSVGSVVSFTNPGLQEDAQGWIDDPSQNFGWLLRCPDEATSRSVRAFKSREGGVGMATLTIMYTSPPVVIEDPIAERIPLGDQVIELRTIADGMTAPLGVTAPDDGSERMFVHDQDGRVWVVTAAGRSLAPLIDVSDRLVTLGAYDERGLLGFAVHPDFAGHPRVYTYTSEPRAGEADFANGLGEENNHQSVIAEWRMSESDPDRVDPTSRRELLRIDQPQSNHNGGAMHFGPDGFLYVALGDGGAANDTAPGHAEGGNGQDIHGVWGSLLRIDPDGSNAANGQYGIPGDNPFVGTEGIDEIYAYGFRNPFAFGFDRAGGQLYLADVGQGRIEEVDIVHAGGNYGWNIKEGTFWFDGTGNIVSAPVREVPAGLVDPIAEYDHDDGSAVIGGTVYRGAALPGLAGRYVFGDWGSFGSPSGRLFYLSPENEVREFQIGLSARPLGLWLKGIGQDAAGELYLLGSQSLGPAGMTGRMLKVVPAAEPLEITGVITAGLGGLPLEWSGGIGPFALQTKNALTDQLWTDESVTGEPVSTATTAGKATGFYRVADLASLPSIPLSASLSGTATRPNPVVTAAGGLGLFSLAGNTLTFSLSYRDLSGVVTGAHIHGPADTSGSAGVLINLEPYSNGEFGTMGSFSGVVVLSDQQRVLLLGGHTYVNIHTPSHPAGEIRGQIVPALMQVELNGGQVGPEPVATAGHGVGTLLLVGNHLSFNLTYDGLSGPASNVHIHGPAAVGENAGVLVGLAPYADGGLADQGGLSGSVPLTPEQLDAVISGRTYINFHTAAHGAGEIRGQILPKPSAVPLTVAMSGQAEKPEPVETTATGSGTLMLEGDRLTLNLQYAGLSGPATGAHIHGPATASGSAGVLINLAPFNAGGFDTDGVLAGSTVLTADQRQLILSGQTYVNIHTAANGAGEIRGQIAPVLMTSQLDAANERPSANDSPATGVGVFLLAGRTLCLSVGYQGLTGTATGAHIHGPASAFQTAGVLVGLEPFNGGSFGESGFLTGSLDLDAGQLGSLIDGQTYLNIHTAANSGGEIRGQITR